MPEHLKAMVVILALAAIVFAIAKPVVCARAMSQDDFIRRRNIWFGVTLVAFLSHNFWIYIGITATLLYAQAGKEKTPLALYFFILFAIPMFDAEIPGLGIVRYLFSINYVRLLALVILLPVFLRLRQDPTSVRFGSLWTDKLVFGFLAVNFVLQIITDSFTNSLRLTLFCSFIDVFLPYYVASRSLTKIEHFRDALAAFVLAAMVMAPVAIFEFVRHWLLYSTLSGVLGHPWDYGHYLERNDVLRAMATTGQPIALGYVMAIACGLYLFLRPSVPKRQLWWFGMALLAAGLIAPVSRGPWTGAAAMLVVFLLTGPAPFANLRRLFIVALVLSPVVYVSGLGDKLIDYLPFVGSVEAENVTYRQLLIEAAIGVILANPFFGAYDYIYSPAIQELKQGQGIIDIVNTYVAIGLSSGFVGLSLFVGALAEPAVGIYRTLKKSAANHDEAVLLGRVLLAVLLATMVVILTVSSITVIPVIYWCLVGMAVAYNNMQSLAAKALESSAAEDRQQAAASCIQSKRRAAGYVAG